MTELYLYAVVLTIIVLILGFWYLNSTSISSILIGLKNKHKQTFKPQKRRVLIEEDLKLFPKLMQQYYEKTGAVGKEIPYNFSLEFVGKFRIDQKKPFMPIKAIQFNYLPEPTRLFVMKLYMFRVITMVGEHEHHQGKGSFVGKLLRLITLFNIKGHEIDLGDLSTFLNDCVLLCPAGLVYLQDRLEWEELSESELSLTLVYKDLKVKANLFFDKEGLLCDFSTRDRFYEEHHDDGTKKWVQMEWRTPILEYETINDVITVKRAKAIWKLPNEDYEYADFTVKSLKFNESVLD
jgi:hypothetical protein